MKTRSKEKAKKKAKTETTKTTNKVNICSWPSEILSTILEQSEDCKDVINTCFADNNCVSKCAEAMNWQDLHLEKKKMAWNCLLHKIFKILQRDKKKEFPPGWCWEAYDDQDIEEVLTDLEEKIPNIRTHHNLDETISLAYFTRVSDDEGDLYTLHIDSEASENRRKNLKDIFLNYVLYFDDPTFYIVSYSPNTITFRIFETFTFKPFINQIIPVLTEKLKETLRLVIDNIDENDIYVNEIDNDVEIDDMEIWTTFEIRYSRIHSKIHSKLSTLVNDKILLGYFSLARSWKSAEIKTYIFCINRSAPEDKQIIVLDAFKTLLESNFKTKYKLKTLFDYETSYEIRFKKKDFNFDFYDLVKEFQIILEKRIDEVVFRTPIYEQDEEDDENVNDEDVNANQDDVDQDDVDQDVDQDDQEGEDGEEEGGEEEDGEEEEEEDEEEEFKKYNWIFYQFTTYNPREPENGTVIHAHKENEIVEKYFGIEYYDHFVSASAEELYWMAKPPPQNIIHIQWGLDFTFHVQIRNDNLRKLVATAFEWHGASIKKTLDNHGLTGGWFQMTIPQIELKELPQLRNLVDAKKRETFFSMFPFLKKYTGEDDEDVFYFDDINPTRPQNFVQAMTKIDPKTQMKPHVYEFKTP